jgi:peptidoglycan/xylan/chitin deacetylase (PgdA/CDA1 family)
MRWRILCYHAIPPESKGSFSDQLTALQDAGYTFVGLSEGIEALRTRRAPGPLVTVTFDDGDATLAHTATEVLSRGGIRACVYIATDYIRTGSRYRDDLPAPTMNWEQVRAFQDAGHEVGSHTHTHAPLHVCAPGRLRQELSTSKDILEQELGMPVRHFAFPWGQYDQAVMSASLATGLYESYATIDRGSIRKVSSLLNRDQVDPAWTPQKLHMYLVWGDLPVYRLRKALRPRSGYWTRHPEETWDELR